MSNQKIIDNLKRLIELMRRAVGFDDYDIWVLQEAIEKLEKEIEK